MRQFINLLLIIIIYGVSSCQKDDNARITSFTISLSTPENLGEATLSGITSTFENVNTGKKITGGVYNNNQINVDLPEGLYHVTIEGKVSYTWEDQSLTSDIKGYQESVSIVGEKKVETIPLFLHTSKADFVISEIFFSGTLTNEGKQYYGDQYIKIYNNSDEILYADGLAVVASTFYNNMKQDISPDIRSTGLAVECLAVIPGNGKQYPVEPGESIILATDGIDHSQATGNSFDLSHADFEFYQDGSYDGDVDNPGVPNMINIYGFFMLNNQGNQTYAIVRLPVSAETFLEKNKHDYTWTYVYPGGTLVNNYSAYQVPNEWIVDAVNLCPSKEYEWLVTAPSVDMGYTYVSENASNNDRYGKSVRRKVSATQKDGRQILQDTNNSSADFIHGTTPSLKQ
ncbi:MULTISPECIES: DUF4876 domain-containing protein [Sanguibacteroides]|uniref:Uncharacterized protein n=1 Tax=Sanguibacteroides justesenii TaxID=1547597 RepID=A0A0C3R6W3_9PORP|nr:MULTISPECIES: DUF4876 domain-containing protein [Sanguibacteroides]KIO43651.1 hypothetical protein IE90_11065 [Sanguibacteroides justesenii]KIO45815.1 hypothetical protein BA92_05005 [Sanguibacteroides justesenii]PXZ45099.1 DUF4876 domain-containing protein [Sanguibacteroides justesenii]